MNGKRAKALRREARERFPNAIYDGLYAYKRLKIAGKYHETRTILLAPENVKYGRKIVKREYKRSA